ncbi:MAG: DUF3363 domain-containing protein, partial [Bradyrhizobium sp.]|nr:DUF3363 domain-containing protein [Bradyrhizobium sp.]
SDGATWLDRQLISRNRIARAPVGFGEEVTKALEARTDELIRQGHASRTPDGVVRARRPARNPPASGTGAHRRRACKGPQLAVSRGRGRRTGSRQVHRHPSAGIG